MAINIYCKSNPQTFISDAVMPGELATMQMELAILKIQALLLKENFDENQPRVPSGNPDGGQWTKDPRFGGGGEYRHPGRSRGKAPKIRPGAGLLPNNDPSKRPKLPDIKPSRRGNITSYAKRVAKWVYRTGAQTIRIGIRVSPVGRFLAAYDAAHWIYNETPSIIAYFDDPKPLAELQELVSQREKGYEIHHIVESTSAARDEFPQDMIESRENKVRIPTYRHHEITGWYAKGNDKYGGLSPRDYLRGKSWQERLKVGYEAMIEKGVLKP